MNTTFFKNLNSWGSGVAQLVKCPTLGFGSSHDPRVLGLSPRSGSALSREAASPSPSAPPPSRAFSLSLKRVNKKFFNFFKKESHLRYPKFKKIF